MPLHFDNSYARLPERFYSRPTPNPVSEPRLLAFNSDLAARLGAEPGELERPENVAALAGNGRLVGSDPIALAYAGHQFGHFVPSLGDGRALLLGEVLAPDGRRFDLQLKGAGRTDFSRGGDGRATLGSVLREYAVSEAMHALGIPTTRALAVVATGDAVLRESPRPGAVLSRVAASHLRVGTFEYFAARRDDAALALLVDQALERHHGGANDADTATRALTLVERVLEAQASLVARWLAVGFVHGVMNTDNCAISGETLDFGPCAFLDGFDPSRTFSSIDQRGRYAYDQQPDIALWNVTRLAIAVAPLLDAPPEATTARLREVLSVFEARFEHHFSVALNAKFGFDEVRAEDASLVQGFLGLLKRGQLDFTNSFRLLYERARGEVDEAPFLAEFGDVEAAGRWHALWQARFDASASSRDERLRAMRRASPAFIVRNHLLEAAIASAERGDLSAFERLVRVTSRPYDDQEGEEDLREPPGAEQWSYRTFCGT